jgi:hypothetical protein
MSPGPTVYCAGEGRRFPSVEFRDDPVHGLVHETKPEHTTLGEQLSPHGLPVLPLQVREPAK